MRAFATGVFSKRRATLWKRDVARFFGNVKTLGGVLLTRVGMWAREMRGDFVSSSNRREGKPSPAK
jgi:hypothetical protein